MSFYEKLDELMKQDFGNRGLLSHLPSNPVKEAADTLMQAKRVILLTGFPVRLRDGTFIGETDGPSGTANLAAALVEGLCNVSVVTDSASYDLLKTALAYRVPEASLTLLPALNTDGFIKGFIADVKPTHFISLERPGKAENGHYHNMRGEIIDDMITDSSLFLSEARLAGAKTISIGDGGNEMGMGFFQKQILNYVPFGERICTDEAADLSLAGGVSNWWGWGLAALLSEGLGKNLLPSPQVETELLKRVVKAGGVDGCTGQQTLTIDGLPLETHLSILNEVTTLLKNRLS